MAQTTSQFLLRPTNMPTRIGTIENYYGGLVVEEINGKYYWAIQDGNTIEYQEIPQYKVS